MSLTTEERIEAILMSGEPSFRVIAADFNNRHPERLPISHNTGRCFISKFRGTGTVADSVSTVALFGRLLRALSTTVPVSHNLEIKHLKVLCEIASLSECQLLKSAAMTWKLCSPDIKMTSIPSSVVKTIIG